jgi:hypothetical protein
MIFHYAERNYAECQILFSIMLSVIVLNAIMLIAIMLSGVMLSAVMLSVMAPLKAVQGPVRCSQSFHFHFLQSDGDAFGAQSLIYDNGAWKQDVQLPASFKQSSIAHHCTVK